MLQWIFLTQVSLLEEVSFEKKTLLFAELFS